jgi:hypothetical protein
MRLFPLLAALGLALIFIWWFLHTPPQQVARRLRQALLWLGGGLLVLLAASGRLHWLFALLGAAAPFVQRLFRLLQLLPLLQRLRAMLQQGRSATGPSSGQSSQVRTRFLQMRLDHDSGAMNGTVLEGRHRGSELAQLSLEQLLELLSECAADEQSANLLQAYLDREHGPDWRERANTRPQPPGGAPGEMSREEAFEILGLQPDAKPQDIVAAHRRLIQKLHPDRGGSAWLAARINLAKDLLLQD